MGLTDPRLKAFLERHATRGTGSERILLCGGSVLSMDPRVGDFAVGDVLIDGDRIAEVGPSVAAWIQLPAALCAVGIPAAVPRIRTYLGRGAPAIGSFSKVEERSS